VVVRQPKTTALQAVAYAVMMIPIGILPYFFGISGWVSMWIVLGSKYFYRNSVHPFIF
jgi:protoheme IX farnesyltransferase